MIDDSVLVNDWHPVASLAQLTQSPLLGTRLLGEDIVVWRHGERVQVWRDLCIHRGAKLSLGKVKDGCLQCPYHGWVYDNTGRCIRFPAHPEQKPPAKAHAIVYHVQVKYDLVWVCLGEPANEVPHFFEWEDEAFAAAVCGPYPHLKAHGPRLIENFLDAAHFPFVHGGVLGDPNQPQIGEYETRIGPNGVESDPVAVFQPNPYGDAAGAVTYTYHAYRPLTAHFNKHSLNATNGLLLTITPHDELDSTAWFIVATTAMDDDEALGVEYEPRIREIFEEDRLIVEGQRPELLPLDLQEELHLRSDRMAIAYRQWLGVLGVKFGVA